MPTAHSREHDRERAREIAERGLILRTTVGSVVHGLSNPGTDDRDEMGICVEPPEYLLGFRRFEHFVYRTQPEGGDERAGRPRPHRLRPMHALRIAHQGIELLRTGRITLPVAEPARSALREVRTGEVPLDEVLRRLDAVTAELERASHDETLPAKPDVAAVDAFVVAAYRRAWDEGLTA